MIAIQKMIYEVSSYIYQSFLRTAATYTRYFHLFYAFL